MALQPRRAFLKKNLVIGTGALLASNASAAEKIIKVGFIGPGGMGTNHLRLLVQRKDVSVDYICEPDATRLSNAVKLVQDAKGNQPKGVKDMRQVLDDKSIDAVWIATPDHWHGPATILACDAGKHVYVEKPCSHNIREGRLMIEAARRNKKSCRLAPSPAAQPMSRKR